ncbi:MAG: hypothetical protein IJD04_03950 [Desulfovibrionaceae bacterium]|nr:hypothetical protein [Desulfovibrionaceae bacterium]
MRWWLVVIGLSLQAIGAVFYGMALFYTRRLAYEERINLASRSLLRPPFLYMGLCSLCTGCGALLMSIFAIIDSDPVILLFQVFLVGVVLLMLFRFRPFY